MGQCGPEGCGADVPVAVREERPGPAPASGRRGLEASEVIRALQVGAASEAHPAVVELAHPALESTGDALVIVDHARASPVGRLDALLFGLGAGYASLRVVVPRADVGAA